MRSNIKTYDNERLVSELLMGSRDAFNEIYNQYAPLLYGFIIRIVKDDKKAESILLEAFIQIWNNRHTYNQENEGLYTWMQRITKIAALKGISKEKNNITAKIQNSFSFVDINNILNEKDSEIQNLIFELIYLNGYSVKEIAELLNIGDDKIKLLLRNAFSKNKTLAQ